MDVGFGEAGDRRTDGSPWSRARSTKRSGLGTDMGEASVEYDLYGCMCVHTYIQTCCVPKWPSEFIFVSTRPPYLLRVVGPRLKGLLLRVGDFVSERLPSATRRSCRDLEPSFKTGSHIWLQEIDLQAIASCLAQAPGATIAQATKHWWSFLHFEISGPRRSD